MCWGFFCRSKWVIKYIDTHDAFSLELLPDHIFVFSLTGVMSRKLYPARDGLLYKLEEVGQNRDLDHLPIVVYLSSWYLLL